jgi:hypothetical protein
MPLLITPLLPLLLAAATFVSGPALASGSARPRAAERKVAQVHEAARVAWAACEVAQEAGAEAACLAAFLDRFEHAEVRAKGKHWPAMVPRASEARERKINLELDALEAALRARVGTEWAALEARLGAPDEALVVDLRAFLDRLAEPYVVLGEVRRWVSLPEVTAAQLALPRAVLGARVVVLDPPPWDGFFANGGAHSTPPVLRRLSAKRNKTIDDARWFNDLDWKLPVVRASAASKSWRIPTLDTDAAGAAPALLGDEPAHHFIVDGDTVIGLYGTGASLLLVGVFDRGSGALLRALDFSHWARAPRALPGDEGFVDQSTRWAAVRDGVLVVSHGHRTYARSSRGHNAYLSAIDLKTGRLMWRSEPLVSNTGNFIIDGDWILSGYGFTAEPDWVTITDRHTGRVARRIKVKTGADWLMLRGDKLYVQTYDTDFVFAVER